MDIFNMINHQHNALFLSDRMNIKEENKNKMEQHHKVFFFFFITPAFKLFLSDCAKYFYFKNFLANQSKNICKSVFQNFR